MKTSETVPPYVYTCNCLCHFPAGWSWTMGDPVPPIMHPCEECAQVRHTAHEAPWEEAGAIAVPAAVRAQPVPLLVRRHTEQSKQIWFDNLYAALPADMLPEDKERITDALLEVAITHGDTLRRKRLIDKLMNAAEATEDMADRNTPTKMLPAETLREWSDLMLDAAEEIRSVM